MIERIISWGLDAPAKVASYLELRKGNATMGLWACRTAYKNPMGISPYKMVYVKACHFPLELEQKAYWAIK